MKALVKFAAGMDGMEIREMPEPYPLDDEVKVRVDSVGICGTDIHIMKDEYPCDMPVIMGHEYVGHVVEIGKDVSRFRVGDRLISLTAKYTCGHCAYCRQGLYMLCPQRKSIGSGMHGAMAEYLTIPERLAYRVPESLPYGEELAMSEPLACCIRAVCERSVVTAGDVALVSGPGTIGLLCMQLARLAGARVVVSGIEADRERLALARRLGAEATAASEEELRRILCDLNPLGADVAFECAGAAASVRTCVRMLKKEGHYTQVALFGREVPVDLDGMLFKELTVHTTYAQEPTSWERLLQVLKSGRIDLKSLFDNRCSLDDWRGGFDRFLKKEGFKIAMRP